jgi:serine/threonine protein kinase
VKLATDPQGRRVALKIFDKSNPHNSEKAMETLKKEAEVYQKLQHPYMVNLLEFKEHTQWKKSDGTSIPVAYMVLELINGGELFDYVAIKNFSVETCRYYFSQMMQVMHYMHVNAVAHRDLKPENIMMDDKFNIRFADFGFAAAMQGHDGTGFLRTILGTTAYMAPELITKTAYFGHSVDLFALGIILFILYSGHPPFNSANPQDPHYRLLAEGRADMFWKQHSKSKPTGFFSESFIDLITNMLQINPCHRLSLADIVGHEWMQGPVADASSVRAEFA